MSALPLLPRFSKILLVGSGLACLPYTVALVAALSVPEIFLPGEQLQLPAEKSTADGGIFLNAQRLEEDAREVRLKSYRQALSRFSRLGGTSDVIKLLAAVLSYAEAPDPQVFCDENFLRAKAMREVHLLRGQLSHLLRADLAYRQHLSQNQGVLPPPSHKQVKYLQQVAASGFVDQVAIRADMAPIPLEQARKPKRAVDVPYLTLFPSVLQHGQDKAVYIHPSSVLGQGPARDAPQYIIYSSLKQSANSSKIRMLPLTPVVQSQLAGLTKGTSLQLNGKPIKEVVVDGPDGVRRERLLIPFLRGSAGGQEWPLPVLQSTQKKVNGSWVDI
ncbi:MAG: putative ATP-dependent RNA helicase DHR1 [Phylliscum demangeonii]|nr:MAG: putative ATP-dependent RNA helicase DHR1 [Phylliscum demangeonii]